MIIKQQYETRMTPMEINSWIKEKKDEKLGIIFKVSKYVIREHDDGFMIRERRLNKYQNFKPRIKGKYSANLSNTKIDVRIVASYSGIFFFSVFLLGFPIAILYSHFFSESLSSNLADELLWVALILIIGVPIMFWALIRPIYIARDWIERELKMNKIK
jgi:hypothetical protein